MEVVGFFPQEETLTNTSAKTLSTKVYRTAKALAVGILRVASTRLGAMTPHTPYCIFAALHKPQPASRIHVAHAVATRLSLCPRLVDGRCINMVHRGSAKQCLPVLETHHIPLEHTGRTKLVRVNSSIEERVAEPLHFGLPSFTLKLRTRLRFLPSTPFNARCDGDGLIFHGAPPLLGRTTADCAARLPRRQSIGYHWMKRMVLVISLVLRRWA